MPGPAFAGQVCGRVNYKGSDDGLTTTEWADKLDIGKGRARRMIRAAIESGKMVHGKRRVTYINGIAGNVDVYRVV